MQLFKGRPLCVIITICLLIIAGCALIPAAIGLIIPAVAAGVLLVVIILTAKRVVDIKYTVIFLFACILITLSGIRGHLYYNKAENAFEKYYGCETTANVTVVENLYNNRYSATMRVRINSLYGERINSYALLECDYEAGWRVGDTFELPITVHSLSELSDDGFYNEYSALSYGFLAYCRSETDNGTYLGAGKSIVRNLQDINESICADIVYYLGDRTGGLASALALGNERYVQDDVERDFRRTGLAHILALSGSHIILIIGTADALLCKLFIRKKLRSAVLFILVPLYVIFVMTPIPALRAGIMYMLFLLSSFFNDDSDAVTNLFLSVFIIVLIMPSAVFSASLWMSFAATLLMVLLMPFISSVLSVARSKLKKKWAFDIARAVTLAAVTAILGTGANIIFSYALFGSFSVVSVVTNVIFGPVLTFLLVVYSLFVLLLGFPQIVSALAPLIKAVTEFVLDLIYRVSLLKYSTISLKSEYAKVICIAVFAIIVVFLIFKFKRKLLVSVPLLALTMCMVVFHIGFATDTDVTLRYVVRGQNEQAVLMCGDEFSIIDVSDGRYSNLKEAVEIAKENGASEIESIALTHYHSYHLSSLRRIFDAEIVRYLILPMPSDEEDRDVLRDIMLLCEEKNVTSVILDYNSRARLSESVYYELVLNDSIKRSSHPTVAYALYIGDESIVYVGGSSNESDEFERVLGCVEMADKVVFGRHGPIPKQKYDFAIPLGTDIYAVNEDIYSVLSELSKTNPVITGKEIWIEFSP